MTETIVIEIDDQRSLTINLIRDGSGMVLTLEDPQNVAVVEMKKPDIVALYEVLEDWIVQELKKG